MMSRRAVKPDPSRKFFACLIPGRATVSRPSRPWPWPTHHKTKQVLANADLASSFVDIEDVQDGQQRGVLQLLKMSECHGDGYVVEGAESR